MKRFLIALVALALCCSMPAAAEGEEPPAEPPAEDAGAGESSEPVIVQVTPQINVEPTPIEITSEGTTVDLYITFAAPEPDPAQEPEAEPAAEAEPELAAVPDVYALADLPEPDALSQVIVSVLGEYRPRIATVTSVDASGVETVSEHIVPGLAGLDWPWIVGAAFFAIMLHGLFVLIGVLLKHG